MTAPLTILGGGPAGLAVAFYAARAGQPFSLYERASTFGGLCRTFHCGDHRYDSGAHRFHDKDLQVTEDVRSLLGDALRPVCAPSQIFDRGRFVDFPPTPLGLLLSTGIRDVGRIGLEVLTSRLRRRDAPRNFAEFAESQFGPSLARRYLLDYSEKLWGLPAEQLSPDVATRRLQGMTVTSLLTEIFHPGEQARHIDGHFLYPENGYGAIADALVNTLPPGPLNAGVEIDALECAAGRIHGLRSRGRSIEVPGLVASTLPLTKVVALARDHLPRAVVTAAARLRFRDVRLVFLRIARQSVTRNASIYVPDPSLAVTRLSEPRNRSSSMAPPRETSLVAEVPCFGGDAVYRMSEETLSRQVIHEIVSLGLIEASSVLEWRHHLLPSAYPVYELGYERHVETILDGLPTLENLHVLGRGGRFFYSHLHDQMRAGRDFVAGLPHTEARAAGA